MRTLLLGWGNPDRQDDGAAWHVLAEVARRSGLPLPEEEGEAFAPLGNSLDLMFALQLNPEYAEIIATYDRVAFIDAHTGAVPNDLNIRTLDPYFQTSPLTHHFTPESCLELTQQLYSAKPEAWLLSVRGFQFGFTHDMSTTTTTLVQQAADILLDWIATGHMTAS